MWPVLEIVQGRQSKHKKHKTIECLNVSIVALMCEPIPVVSSGKRASIVPLAPYVRRNRRKRRDRTKPDNKRYHLPW